MTKVRKISQIIFLALFGVLFLAARYPYGSGIPSDLFLKSSPLIAIGTMLASRSFIAALFPALLILLLTIPLGRFFCGWICPLGTLIDMNDHLIRAKYRQAQRSRRIKFFILFAILFAALISVQLYWFFDPIALLFRTVTLVVYPAFVFLVNGLFAVLFQLGWFEDPVYLLYDFLQSILLPVEQPAFNSAIPVLLIFITILAFGKISRRFWCRNLCPLGALLGLFSKYRLLNRSVDGNCSQCAGCVDCRMNAVEDDYVTSNSVECVECGECVDNCPTGAIRFRWGRGQHAHVDFDRRRVLQSAVTGVTGALVLKSVLRNPVHAAHAMRPPGALSENEFLDRCARCQACVCICSTTGACLQPALLESGWEGIWSPVSVPAVGYCEYNCNLCGQVCPTGAIRLLDLADKQAVKMGMAYFNKDYCIPWYKGQNCLVCEEHCPVPNKAIRFDEQTVKMHDGTLQTVKLPYIVESLCTGCGICENKCPLNGVKGVKILGISENH